MSDRQRPRQPQRGDAPRPPPAPRAAEFVHRELAALERRREQVLAELRALQRAGKA